MALFQLKQKKAPEWLVSINSAPTPSPPLSPTAASAATALKKKSETPLDQGSRVKKVSVLSTLYPLNVSRCKSVAVGLYYSEESQSFSPMVHLTNATYSYNIYMDNATWTGLQNHFDKIAEFFEAPISASYPSDILINTLQISFKHACGSKAIQFVDLACPLTVRDLNKSGIIMHKKTFDGMRRASVCADERFRRISAVCAQVNKCKDEMREAVYKCIDSVSGDDEHFASLIFDLLILNSRSDEILQNVKQSFVNAQENVFLNHYFDVVYLELALIPSVFISEMKSARHSKK